MRGKAFAVLVVTLAAAGAAWPSDELWVRRSLPDCYVPGRPVTVHIGWIPWSPGAELRETFPPGWSLLETKPSATTLDEAAGTIFWDYETTDAGAYDWLSFRYVVLPPPEQRGEVCFHGRLYRPAGDGPGEPADPWDPPIPELDVTITGDSTISDRVGQRMYRPHWATIQQTIEASLWGDTVMVSGGDTPFIENIVMKPGVNLVGFVEWPIYEPPVIEAASPAEPAIVAAPYTRISGFIIRSSSCGIRVNDPTVEICDCVISQTENAAIEYVETSEGRVTNCTIVGNNDAGILCHEPSPDVVASNCIFLGNAGNDVENCTARFCLLEDQIEPGWGEDNISADPMSVNAAEGDYRLLRGSPCIDAGDNAARGVEGVDILGKPRIMFGGKSETVDLGAYEHWFMSASRKAGTGDVELSWSSRPGRVYSVSFSGDLKTWDVADDNVPASEGTMTVWRDAIGWPPLVPTRFYRVAENE